MVHFCAIAIPVLYLVGIVCIVIMAKIAPECAAVYAIWVFVICAALTGFVRIALSQG